MGSITGEEKVDRLPVKITCNNIDQLLGVPITDGTGLSTATFVNILLQEWNISVDMIEACCFDTTSVNTGRLNGAGVLLEKMLDKKLLFLCCRHHIYELVLKAVFEKKVAVTSAPEEPLFVRFKKEWPAIKSKQYHSGIEESDVANSLKDIIDTTKTFILSQLKKPICRDDYKEFLELAMLFVGGNLNKSQLFHPPGPNHHARLVSNNDMSFFIH